MNLLALLFTVGYLQQNSPMCHWADDFFSLLFCSGIFVNNLPVLLQAYESDFTSVCFRNASEWSLKRCPFMATRSVTASSCVIFISRALGCHVSNENIRCFLNSCHRWNNKVRSLPSPSWKVFFFASLFPFR